MQPFTKIASTFKLPVLLFFSIYFLIGITIHRDYGISWDEPIQRGHGTVSWDAVNKRFDHFFYQTPYQNKKLTEYKHRHYGVLFQMVALQLERILNIESEKEQFYLRHLMGFLLFFTAVFFFYKIILLRTNSWKWGLVGASFLILSPRLFAHSFFNPKDTITLSFFIIATFTFLRFLEHKNYKTALWHALACGLLLNTRIVGIVIPVLTLAFMFWEAAFISLFIPLIRKLFKDSTNNTNSNNSLPKIQPTKTVLSSLLFIIFTGLFTYIFWPYLWDQPFIRFPEVWKTFSQYQWKGEILYWGKYVLSTDLPWHYIPSYMLVSTPLIFGPLFLLGFGFLLKNVAFSRFCLYRNQAERIDLILLALFLAPLLAVILLNSVMYDGWRHMYFIYSGFLGLTIIGLYQLHQLYQLRKKRVYKWIWYITFCLVLLNMSHVLYWMVRYHPHQNTYFNPLIGKEALLKMEIDYWGQGFKHLYEILAEIDKSEEILVRASHYPGWENYKMLSPELQERFKYNWPKENIEAGYYLTIFRGKDELIPYINQTGKYKNPVYLHKVGNTPILGIYCIENEAIGKE